MGDCFSYELIDMTTTHIILPDDDPQIVLTLEVYLAFIYGWLVCLFFLSEKFRIILFIFLVVL